MAPNRKKVSFTGATGATLAGMMELPDGEVGAHALFAHCFTCGKDIAAASRISRALAARGIAVLRFDFTGLGNSDGDFANTDFSSNVGDLIAAADHMREHFRAPRLLIGHSLGGAAVLAAAGRIPEARAVATIGAPSTPAHVQHLFTDQKPEILADGRAEVILAGRPFTIRREFLEDLDDQRQEARIAGLDKALIVFHSPVDGLVAIDEAARIYTHAKHPKSFVSLDDADHLLTRASDAAYVAEVLTAWVSRYLTSR